MHTGEGQTQLTLKELTPVRLIKNDFYKKIEAAYEDGATPEELTELLGRGRARGRLPSGIRPAGEHGACDRGRGGRKSLLPCPGL